ncbi:MAG: UbiA family prenyltransferase, partial [Candidatus Lokiarchaeota archaeon]|nr:UbiA family prenyltransferase [Candidatus Lokiarchaeota archaeon]
MTSKIRSISHLLRVRQYYKNVLIFVGVFFSRRIFDSTLYFPLILGFILLCCASSFNYIINDIRDVEQDKKHQEKLKKKPLASGELPMYFAALLLIAIVGIMVISVIFLIPNLSFVIMLTLVILTGQFYNHFFKNYAFIDILVLSTGYLWRALSGVVIIELDISAWLFLAIFEIAMFLSIAKRKGDLMYLGKDKAVEHKKVYDQYSLKLLDQFHVLIAGSLFMTYSLYLIFIVNLFGSTIKLQEYILIFTIPISLYIIMRFMYLTSSKPEIARRT